MSSASVRLGTPVRVRDVRVGVVTAVLMDASGERAFGLEVSAPTGGRWFLPWVAADVRGDAVEAGSALVSGDRDQLDAYARRGARIVREGDGLLPARASAERVLAGVLGGRSGS
jgi:hypothetical protein